MRQPDLIIGTRAHPQTLRWHLLKRRGWQFALHKWCRSDEDRALHDHSGDNVSILLTGCYWEIVREYWQWAKPSKYFGPPGIWQRGNDGRWYRDVRRLRLPFIPYFRRAETPHRVVLCSARPVWTLWLRWPPCRFEADGVTPLWGFWCPKGWRPWKEFCSTRDYSAPGSTSEVGRGCD